MKARKVYKAFVYADGTVAPHSELTAQDVTYLLTQNLNRFEGYFKINGNLVSERHLQPDIDPSSFQIIRERTKPLPKDVDGFGYEFFGERASSAPALRELTLGVTRDGFYFQFARKLPSPLPIVNRQELFQFHLDRFGRFLKLEHYQLEENTRDNTHKYTELSKLNYPTATGVVREGLQILFRE